jgi:hypothetical protein
MIVEKFNEVNAGKTKVNMPNYSCLLIMAKKSFS